MKTAKAIAQVLDVTCPYCGEDVTDPKTGSYMILSDTFPLDEVICQVCGKHSKLPRTAKVFA